MTHDEETSGGNLLWRVIRVVVPWIGLIVVVTVILSLVTEYRRSTSGEESTNSVEATSQAGLADGETYVRVLSDGLNLRSEATTSSAVVAVLSKEEKLQFVSEVAGWYQVRRSDGAQGWVAAGGRYTELITP